MITSRMRISSVLSAVGLCHAMAIPVLFRMMLLFSALPAAHAQTVDSFNPNAGSYANSFAVSSDGGILSGGDFTTMGGQMRNRIARLNSDGSLVSGFNPNANNIITSIVMQEDGRILVGGLFTTLGGQTSNHVARLNADGSIDPTFLPDVNNTVTSLVPQANGMILMGGLFTTLGGQACNRIVRLNPDGSRDAGFNANADSNVECIVLQPDGKILVGGWFTMISGQACNYLARLNDDGSRDAGFNPSVGSGVYSIALQADGKILITTTFLAYGGQTRYFLARLNADGSLDSGFNPDIHGGIVNSVTLQADGRIVVGGKFYSINGETRNGIARLNADGSTDPGFDPNANNNVQSLALQADGKILVGGTFRSIGGQTRNRIARLTNDTAATSTLSVIGSSRIDWIRGGSSPEISQVTYECWDGGTWVKLGDAARIQGGWSLLGINLPASGRVRARGRTRGGFDNASSSIIEETVTFGPLALFDAAVSVAGLVGEDAQPEASPFGDGVSNILKYAFNMNLSAADVRILSPVSGTAGLPVSRIVAGVLHYEYLRRKNSGLTYTPQQSSSLTSDSWQAATGAVTVTSIDQTWERVTIEQALGAVRFLRVLVTLE